MGLEFADEDAPDFDVEEAYGELFTNNRTMDYAPWPTRNRMSWAQTIEHGNIKLPPPPWWLAEQDAKGRERSKFAIWSSRYSRSKQLGKWLVAPLEDFRRAKFLRKKTELTYR